MKMQNRKGHKFSQVAQIRKLQFIATVAATTTTTTTETMATASGIWAWKNKITATKLQAKYPTFYAYFK